MNHFNYIKYHRVFILPLLLYLFQIYKKKRVITIDNKDNLSDLYIPAIGGWKGSRFLPITPQKKNSKKYFLRLHIIHLFITCWVIEVLEVLLFSLVKRDVVSTGRMAKIREHLGLAVVN